MPQRKLAQPVRSVLGDWHFGKFYARERGAEVRLALSAAALRRPATFLDIGSADGAVALASLRPGDRLVAVDIDPVRLTAGLAEARSLDAGTTFVQADAVALPIRDASCDVAILYEILEHVPDMRRVVQEVGRVLRVGGVVYVVTPNPRSPLVLIEDPHAHLPLTHILPQRVASFYAERLMRRQVQELGRHFVLPSWSQLQSAFGGAGMRLRLQSNLVKVEHPELVLSKRRRMLAKVLRRAGVLRLGTTRVGLVLLRFYDRWLARSWAFVGERVPEAAQAQR